MTVVLVVVGWSVLAVIVGIFVGKCIKRADEMEERDVW